MKGVCPVQIRTVLAKRLSPMITSQGSSAIHESYMESQNDEALGALGNKVSELRELSIAIGKHVKEDNSLLNDLDNRSASHISRCHRLPRLTQTRGDRCSRGRHC